jgi:hypothetical protein
MVAAMECNRHIAAAFGLDLALLRRALLCA